VKAFVRNADIYELIAPGKWANRVSAYLLRYSGEDGLSMGLRFEDPADYSTSPFEIAVYANQELVSRLIISEGGEQSFYMPLGDIQGETLELSLVCNAHIISVDPEHLRRFMVLNLQLEQ